MDRMGWPSLVIGLLRAPTVITKLTFAFPELQVFTGHPADGHSWACWRFSMVILAG